MPGDAPYRRSAALAWLPDALIELEQAGLKREIRSRDALPSRDASLAHDASASRDDARFHQGPQHARLSLDGQTLVNFGSNDYLSLAADPRLIAAAAAALHTAGCGAGASPLVTGHGAEHARLERRLAEFEHAEAALGFPSGYAANVGVIGALVGPGDVIYSDRKNHASLIDGCRLSRADVVIYPHGDWRALERLLAAGVGRRPRRRLIVTDGVFSMDGDLAPLERLVRLAERYTCMSLVDEAHGTGVFGAGGRGACELQGVAQQVDVRIGTLSKALGSQGGFVVGRRELIEWILNRARPYIFSTALAPPLAAAARVALDIVEQEPWRRQTLLARAAELRGRLRAVGWRLLESAGPIIPLVVGDERATMTMATALREAGFLVPGIRPPSVPAGESLLRLSLCYAHTPEMIAGFIDALARVRSQGS